MKITPLFLNIILNIIKRGRIIIKSSIIKPLFVIVLASAMIQLGNISFNVLTPVLSDIFSAPVTSVQWVIVGYMLTLASVTPFAAWFSGKYSGKKILLLCTTLYGIVSFIGAFSTNIYVLIIFRMLMGAVGAMAGPIGMAIAYKICDKDKVGQVMGIIGIPIFMTPALGPILSGWLADIGSWRAIMYINLPISVILLIFGLLWLPLDSARAVGKADVAGMSFAPVMLISLIYGLQNLISDRRVNIFGLAALLIGAAAFVGFVKQELSCDYPILRIDLFKKKPFRAAVILLSLSALLVPGFLFLLPLFFQRVYGWSAFMCGLIMLPIAAASAVGMPFGGRAYDKHGVANVVYIGFTAATLGILMFWLFSGLRSIPLTILSFCVVGFGLGYYSTSLTTNVLAQAPKELVDNASAINSTCMLVVNALAITISSAILTAFSSPDSFNAPLTYARVLIVTFCVSLFVTAISVAIAKLSARRV
ncbi:MAG: MFS transporter [Clostridiales bacterium]|jgi:EmrB/QacA subfamily drug resistance transporter|nr:MFS transporter [Clostridiales bacterium]